MEKSEHGKTIKQSLKDGSLSLIYTVLVARIRAFITTNYIQPWIARPALDILGGLPIHLYEEKQNPFLAQTSPVKTHYHKLAIILKVKNASSSTAAIIHKAWIEGCINMDNNPIAAEMNLSSKEQMEKGCTHERHKYTVQRLHVSGIFQEAALTVIVVQPQATEYIGVLSPTSPGPDFIIPGSASLSGECSKIKVSNRWAAVEQLLEGASLRTFPRSLRKKFANGQLKIYLLGANTQTLVLPSQIKPLISQRWAFWPDLLLPPLYENPGDHFPPLKRAPG
jgi:hypothetical protein